VDTSGANVAFSGLSLAERLGARNIELYGTDFSYPRGRTYARGTYLYPFFENRQKRLSPLESLRSAFLYRSPLTRLSREAPSSWYYETGVLRMYRERMEAKIRAMNATVRALPGLGAPLAAEGRPSFPQGIEFFSSGKAAMGARDFLEGYREDIKKLPPFKGNIGERLESLGAGENMVLTTLLPAAAAIRHRRKELRTGELLEELRDHCLKELDRVLEKRQAGV
jgi:hypothetical protein